MLAPKHIVITGASGGIGAALALAYAAPSIRLSLQGRAIDRLNEIAQKVEKRGASVSIKPVDVTDAATMREWLLGCERLQPIDLIIANAGISAGSGMDSETEEQAQAIFATNMIGVLNSIHPVIPFMKTRQAGQIAIMSSLAGFMPLSGAPAYSASKAAVRLYGEALRADLRHYGIAVNVICPGFIDTLMTRPNPFPMPMLMSATRAALIIRHGLAKNQARIAFPWPIYALVSVVAMLPQGLMNWVVGQFPKKKPM